MFMAPGCFEQSMGITPQQPPDSILSDFLSIVHSILFAPLSQFHSGLLRETKILLAGSLSFETGDQENKFATFSGLSFSKMTSVVFFYHMVAACIHLFLQLLSATQKILPLFTQRPKYYIRLPYFYLEPKFHINCLNQTNIIQQTYNWEKVL